MFGRYVTADVKARTCTCTIEIVIKQCKWHAFGWTPVFVPVEPM